MEKRFVEVQYENGLVADCKVIGLFNAKTCTFEEPQEEIEVDYNNIICE